MAGNISRSSVLSVFGRGWSRRLGAIFLLTALVGMLLVDRSGGSWTRDLRGHLADGLSPVLQVVAAPQAAAGRALEGMRDWVATYSDNQRLRVDNSRLLQWQGLAKELQIENERLRALLNVAPRRTSAFITASLTSGFSAPLSGGALLSAGHEDGVGQNQAVISERGLIGRVMEVGGRSASVLLLTDMNSRVPVMNERTREKMILAGRNASLPMLSYVASDSTLRKGDRIITSGDGGVFPKNIPIGVVREADKGAAMVELFATAADTEYVVILGRGR